MAENKAKKEDEIVYGKNIVTKNLDEVMHDSMMPYSEHVILDRALPRVEDGLKPVQRRILFTMNELGITPDKPHKKCARIVGEVLGKYHPHGDTAVYGALVRLAQDFNMREPLVDGHGNFGSIDGDSAAAMRYTEARMTPLALEILRDLDKNTVPWQLNFDDSLKEPSILPCRFPNLLVNGANGIAVGLATNIPTHNLGEVISGVVALIDHKNMKLEDLMKIIKGPDFPTGGYIIAGEELAKAYETGKGKITERAKIHIETLPNDSKNIVITELPYQVNKAQLLQRILELRETKKDLLAGIADIRDESDRNGMRAVVRVRKDADANAILGTLFKYTDLQTTFGINMVAIADGRPQQMGLIQILTYYINYQRDIIYKRTKYDLDVAKEREHILEGLIIAVRNIDEVVKIIKKSESVPAARSNLRARFNLSEKQAQAILDMRLARLTSLEVFKLEQELAEVKALIIKLTEILNSKKLQLDIVKQELLEIKKKYKSERRSKIISNVEEYPLDADPNAVVVEDVVVGVSEAGTIKRMSVKHMQSIAKQYTDKTTLNELYTSLIPASTADTLLMFTSKGNVIKLSVTDIPDARWREKGAQIAQICTEFQKNERIIAVFVENALPKNAELLFFTKQGFVKRTACAEYTLAKKYYQAMKLKDDDEILSIEFLKPEHTMVFITKQGMCLNASMDDIPVQGRISGGVRGINLAEKDEVLLAKQITNAMQVAIFTNKGYAKRIHTSMLDVLARYRKGYKVIDLKTNNGTHLIAAFVLPENHAEIVLQDALKTMTCVYSKNLAEEPRVTKGKPLVKGSLDLEAAYIYTNELTEN